MDKKVLRSWLAAWDLPAILAAAAQQGRLFGLLLALTYDPEALFAWRAVEAIGLAAAQIVDQRPDRVRNQLRRLVWLLNDESGSIGWRAPEAIGEILYRCPARNLWLPPQ